MYQHTKAAVTFVLLFCPRKTWNEFMQPFCDMSYIPYLQIFMHNSISSSSSVCHSFHEKKYDLRISTSVMQSEIEEQRGTLKEHFNIKDGISNSASLPTCHVYGCETNHIQKSNISFVVVVQFQNFHYHTIIYFTTIWYNHAMIEKKLRDIPNVVKWYHAMEVPI